jgi:hypothetical protein
VQKQRGTPTRLARDQQCSTGALHNDEDDDKDSLWLNLRHDDEDGWKLATRAAHSLCLTSESVRAAVLASVQRVRMDTPRLPVLQHMGSLVSLRVGRGPIDPIAQLPQLTRLWAYGISSPQDLSAIMQLTRLEELVLGIGINSM